MQQNQFQTNLKYPDIQIFLDAILPRMQEFLAEKLVGLYLFGSLALGDFDYEISDVDLLAATAGDLDENEFGKLEKMHDQLVENNPQWKNRLEIAYLSLNALKTFKTQTSQAAMIRPGEPFHFKESEKHWLIDWYVVRKNGVTLFGPPPEIIIEPISKEEFVQAVREQAVEWGDYVKHAKHSRSYQGYVILTMCRAFYAVKNGDQALKKQAALWAQKLLPEWSSLIQNAVEWREKHRDENVNHELTFPKTNEFVHFIIEQIEEI